MRLALALFALLWQQSPTVPNRTGAVGSGGGGGGSISIIGTKSVDSGTVATVSAVDFGSAIAAGSGIVLSITFAGGPGTASPTVCDSTTNATCTSSASTYTSLTKGTSGGSPNTQFFYTCNAAANVRFFSFTLTGAEDETLTITAFNHSVTSGCADAHPTVVGGTAGATLTSNTYTTAVANEIAISSMADDTNCGPTWTGAAGSGFTLANIASTCSSMLGATEYKIYTTTQSSVTSTLTTGNSSGNTVAFDTATFE
jgi:hypothetical protein